MLLVYLCWTVGIAMPDLWYQNASLFWYRFFYLIYSQYFKFDLSPIHLPMIYIIRI